MLFGEGPVFPAACTTNIPAFTAASKAISKELKKVAKPGGRLLGAMDKLMMSTPSWAACQLACQLMNEICNPVKEHRINNKIK